ncbi:MAG TPA: PDDEXK nuclease domain-containing protein, partial [Kofleriaceae bacterium]|nr:PDDEXK nuclease domain-containing protein [Kofleriaceae bacterium]
RHMRRLVAIELKLGEFKPGDMGQMTLYLNWLNRYERNAGEEQPIGLILCSGQKRERIELLDLGRSGIRVASYWTDLLPKKKLERKLHDAVRLAQARLKVMDRNDK